MSLFYLILWNQVDILQKHVKKDHVHMRLWTRFYDMPRNKYGAWFQLGHVICRSILQVAVVILDRFDLQVT